MNIHSNIAHDALSIATQQTISIDNKLKNYLRLICDECIICFADNTYLVYKRGKSYRQDTLKIVTCHNDLPFSPLDLDLIDFDKDFQK